MEIKENTISGWLLKYIIPIIIIPIFTSGVISYGAVKSIGTQQKNDGRRIVQIEKSADINRMEISKHNERLSKLEILVERINKSLDENGKELRLIRSEISDIGKIVVVLKDRIEREDKGHLGN